MSDLFNENDKQSFIEMGIAEATILNQIDQFKKGIPFLKLSASAVIPNGIKQFDNEKQLMMCLLFDELSATTQILKFVPASGAASRMFKDMFSLREKCLKNKDDQNILTEVAAFFDKLPHFAFFNDLKKKLSADSIDINQCISESNYLTISEYILNEKGLNYANTPKALIKFHNYGHFERVAIEEHFVEAALYCINQNNEANLHFTISPEHEHSFLSLINKEIAHYHNLFKVKFNISYSFQKPSTDTIAVDMNNQPFRESDGTLVFRPGGHGALIENLNDCKEQLIFVKNIDNIVPDRLKETTVKYKKVIGGLLVHLKDRIKDYLEALDKNEESDELLLEIADFSKEELFISIDSDTMADEKKLKEFLIKKLNRPIRVCGMVLNEGEPGGGPYWVENPANGEISLQIVESSQVDLNNPAQKTILTQSTHFNPVDLVCWTYDYKGNKFNLLNYVDTHAGFISIKSKDGRELKALELPGLWNGAMADWITVFVDVPLITFNPVKTIDDLLRKEHDGIERE